MGTQLDTATGWFHDSKEIKKMTTDKKFSIKELGWEKATNLPDGEYYTIPKHGPQNWRDDRKIIKIKNRVKLVDAPDYSWSAPFFFEANNLLIEEP